MVNIYVLELEQGKYYVGKTNHTFQRFNQHVTGDGAKWTKEYKVKDLFEFHRDRTDGSQSIFVIHIHWHRGILFLNASFLSRLS